ncbi:MAG: 1-deoxy-D-xylulose-5-phosphate synthase [Armatimonadota bacterium]|nr:1-deoxy-D-xylulose-5-phosphate synthase [Armatimonadota bacterium]MDW8025785.1 1-deoxy-D-xylulose-5-phosphate synthase [Armatimonadota bacterium]
MASLLERIRQPQDLKGLSHGELEQLARELREVIIRTVSKSGGHLAPALGAVEIAVAVHATLDSPKDKIIWDTGHQAYAHKLLTGRYECFHTLRQYGGISGFLRRDESEHDVWGAGHAGTGLSAAMGFAIASKMCGSNDTVLVIVGDGALQEGMAWEALHNIGDSKLNIIVILNDNAMAIAPSVGALEKYLRKLRSSPPYLRLKEMLESALLRLPKGQALIDVIERWKDSVKQMIIPPGMIFEELGFAYLGPINGHSILTVMEAIREAKTIGGPVIIHALTRKGFGYEPAEKDPCKYHSVPPFEVHTGELRERGKRTYTSVFGDTLVRLAESDPRIIAITAAMPDGTGLRKFSQRFPERYFDVGMAEQHAVTFAAALALNGFKPVVAIYSTFLQRAFDQIVHDVCLQRAPVVFAIDRSGLVGEDGQTHHGTFDIAFLRMIPNMVLMMPKDENELQHMLFTAVLHDGPVAVRYPKGEGVGVELDEQFHRIEIGRWETIKEGRDATIIAIGDSVYRSLEASEILGKQLGYDVGVVNARFVKPLDMELIKRVAEATGRIITVEEHCLDGGFGSAVLEALSNCQFEHVRTLRIGIHDRFVEHGPIEVLRQKLMLDAHGIASLVARWLSPQSDELKSDRSLDDRMIACITG